MRRPAAGRTLRGRVAARLALEEMVYVPGTAGDPRRTPHSQRRLGYGIETTTLDCLEQRSFSRYTHATKSRRRVILLSQTTGVTEYDGEKPVP